MTHGTAAFAISILRLLRIGSHAIAGTVRPVAIEMLRAADNEARPLPSGVGLELFKLATST